ncbi:MAG: AMP-binding protein [Burkholderiaceae bacterium]
MNTAAQVCPMGSSVSAPPFWRHFLSWAELHWEGSASRVAEADGVAVFPDLRLNYAENLLLGSGAEPDAIAVTACHADGRRVRLTRAELQARVEQMGEVLREQGVGVGDRVVAILRNDADAVVTALSVAAIGASLTIAAPETAAPEIAERFGALAPRLLIAHVATLPHDTGEPMAARVVQVAAALPSLDLLVTLGDTPLRPVRGLVVRALPALLEGHRADEFHWQRFAFDQPLFAHGAPASAGGSLIEHVRQHRLDCKLSPHDKLFLQASCASMAWHWQLSALATGCEIVLYDGPMMDAVALRRIVQSECVTLFGTRPPGLPAREGVALE